MHYISQSPLQDTPKNINSRSDSQRRTSGWYEGVPLFIMVDMGYGDMYGINTNLELFSYYIMVDMKGVCMVLVSIFSSFHSFIQNLTPEHLAKTFTSSGFPNLRALAVDWQSHIVFFICINMPCQLTS